MPAPIDPMPAPLSPGCSIAALAFLFATGLSAQTPGASPIPERGSEAPSPVRPVEGKPSGTPRHRDGHLVLIVEGDGSALAVRHAVAKAGRFAGPHKGLKSEFRYVAIDARGRDLVTIPIDAMREAGIDPHLVHILDADILTQRDKQVHDRAIGHRDPGGDTVQLAL